MKQGTRPCTDCVAGNPGLARAIALSVHLRPMRCPGRSTGCFALSTGMGQRQIGATASAQNALRARFVGALKRRSKREPLIGVRFSDSSRDLRRGSRGARSANPAILADLSGLRRLGYWTKIKRMLKCVSVGYEKTLRDVLVGGAKLSLALGWMWTANSGGRKL